MSSGTETSCLLLIIEPVIDVSWNLLRAALISGEVYDDAVCCRRLSSDETHRNATTRNYSLVKSLVQVSIKPAETPPIAISQRRLHYIHIAYRYL